MEHNYMSFKDAFQLLDGIDIYKIYDMDKDELVFKHDSYAARKERPIVSTWSRMEQYGDYGCDNVNIDWRDDGCCATFYIHS